jgi:hypothetical protein
MPERFDPSRMIDDVVFLQRAHEVLDSLADMRRRRRLEKQGEALATAEREVARWHARREMKLAHCALPAACTKARCRRARVCKALPLIASKIRTAEARLAAERAKRPAPTENDLVSQGAGEHRGKGGKPKRVPSMAPGSRIRALRVPG